MPPVFSKPGAVKVAAGFSATSLVLFAVAVRRAGLKAAAAAVNNGKKDVNSATITLEKKKNSPEDAAMLKKKQKKKSEGSLNGDFLRRFSQICRIILPGPLTPEVGFGAMVLSLLAVRTSFDILILHITTAIERAIISGDRSGFVYHLSRFFLVMVPVSCVNCLLKYGQMELRLRFRSRLTTYLYRHYLTGYTYYQISNLDGRLANVDQSLTTDVEKFAASLADLYSNLTKPLLDIVIYAYKLSHAVGLQAPTTMLSYLIGSGAFLTWCRQPTGLFTIAEQMLEGNFRYINSRLQTHSEEIAFYDGKDKESGIVSASFSSMIGLLRRSQQFRFAMSVVDNIVAKYFATVVGFFVVSRPFLSNEKSAMTQAERMQDYFRSGRMMIKLSEAMGRLVLSGRELTRLAGFTHRVTELMTVLDDLNHGHFQRKNMSSNQMKNGRIKYQDHLIKFENVPLVTPNGDILVKSLSMEVITGRNVVVCGPNGCGKSSLFRILGGLWPLIDGTLTKPARANLFYIPQRPYLTLGSLREQLIYPHSTSSCTDEQLLEYLELVQLAYIATRSKEGLDLVCDWADLLSGGEKQRLAMARLFYHKPQFAILDECTSAVSVDVEGAMYKHCQQQQITLFTVSHRKSLWPYHEYVLQFDGRGAYKYQPIDQADEAFGS